METMEIYTDGACKNNPGEGGWGVFWINPDTKKEHSLYGYEPKTTNNRMELLALIRALEHFPSGSLTLYTDSNYAYKGITEWIRGWKKNGWKTSQKKEVLNKDLWERLDNLTRPDIKFQWVKAHNQNYGNEKADHFANVAIQEKK